MVVKNKFRKRSPRTTEARVFIKDKKLINELKSRYGSEARVIHSALLRLKK